MVERYGEYELFHQIATGGMAEIHLGRHVAFGSVNRLVIIKRMLPQLAVRPDFVTMFLDEARLTAALQHPNIVAVRDLGEVAGSYFIAMELVDGPHLGSLFAHSLRARAPLPVDLCAYVAARAAVGLHHAHERNDAATGLPLNLVHRDVSPQNILVGKGGEVKVTDFGVAKTSNQKTKTRTGIIKGKVSYMSPEQCLGDRLDRRSDVFALGIVLYELLTRRRLFRDKSDMLVMQRITAENVAPPSSLNSQVDDGLDLILRTALSRELGTRYQTALELAETLTTWIAGRVDESALAQWFSEHCPELALSASLSEDALHAPELAPTATSSPPDAPATWIPASRSASVLNISTAAGEGLKHPRPESTSTTAAVPVLAASVFGGVDLRHGGRFGGVARVVSAGLLAALALVVVVVARAYPRNSVVAAAPPLVAATTLHVETVPSGVQVIVGDRVVGKSPLRVEVPTGKASVQAQFLDQPTRTVDVDVVAGSANAVRVQAWVPLIVRSTPSRARLSIEGQARGETPFEQGFLVQPGVAVLLRLEAEGMQTFEERVTATAGQPLVRDVRLEPLAPPSPNNAKP